MGARARRHPLGAGPRAAPLRLPPGRGPPSPRGQRLAERRKRSTLHRVASKDAAEVLPKLTMGCRSLQRAAEANNGLPKLRQPAEANNSLPKLRQPAEAD